MLYKMHISKINEVHLKVETEPSIARELADYFTFEVPGHRFMPAYKIKYGTERYDCSQLQLVEYMLGYCGILKGSVIEMT